MKKKKRIRINKKLYIYMAFVTMAAVSLFAKPFKKGLSALNRRLRRSSQKGDLRAQLALNQQTFSSPIPLTIRSKKNKRPR